MESGISIYGIFDIYGGLGFVQGMGTLVSEDGSSSTEHDMITIYPISLNSAMRISFSEKQVLVPYVSGGIDYWIWRENWIENDVEVDQSGGKSGWHYAIGGQLLLDRFDEIAASKLFVRFGIKDTYLTGEYRTQDIGSEGLEFDGSSTTFGFRFVY